MSTKISEQRCSAEVILHSAVYAEVPAANSGLSVAQRVLDELEAEGPS